MSGIAQYANGGLHGFARVSFKTNLTDFDWINYGMFVGEWVGATNSGTGNAKLDIFEVFSGGRRDGKPIEAIEPATE
ncbi:hypothetical protein BJX63DRAFT_436731 [Aspergillus granulosus]|uniref:Uncharacterized protein n=1 Tax=Aspergillus granulosus TaxID=176169 RepID=A0ABR4GXA6_9EURO